VLLRRARSLSRSAGISRYTRSSILPVARELLSRLRQIRHRVLPPSMANKGQTGPARRPNPRAAPRRSARSTGPELVVLSMSRATAYEPSRHEVCISITDPHSEPVQLSPKFADVLRLSFSDIIEPIPLPSHRLFAQEHATAILEFIGRWPNVERIVVHCVAGLSRSPAVALAIADLYERPTGELERQFPMWNTWVRQQLLEAGRTRSAHRRTRRRRAPD
jgi:predicted protein tyrosine phosphatase